MATISIPRSRVVEFNKTEFHESLRWGQAFYEFMEFQKVTSTENKIWADKLYNASDKEAKAMVIEATDYSC